MLSYIVESLSKSQPRAIPKYRFYISNLKMFLKNKTLQYLQSDPSYSYGMRLLNQLCHMVDISYMNKFSDDAERYAFYLHDLREAMLPKFDTTKTGSVFRRYYITTSNTKEFVIANDDINTLSYLPLNKGWDVWRDIDCVRLWWHDSQEFSLNMINSKIRFYEDLPQEIIILIDPIALAFKWYKFQTEGVKTLPEDIYNRSGYFLQHCIYNTFQYQLTDIWLMSQLKWLMSVEEKDIVESRKYSDIQVETQYGKITVTYTDGMLALWKELELIRKNNIPTSSFIYSKLLLDSSLYDRIQEALNRWSVTPNRNYEYIQILKDLDLFKFLFALYQLNPKSTYYKTMMREFKIQINRMYNRRPWKTCKNSDIRRYLENTILELREKI